MGQFPSAAARASRRRRHGRAVGLLTALLIPGALAACEPEVLPPVHAPTHDDISYLHAAVDEGSPFTIVGRDEPGGRQTLDIHLPAPSDEPAPVLVVVPGGSWLTHDETVAPLGGFERYLDRGFAVVNVDYRPAGPDVRFPQLAYDVSTAVRWIRAHAHRLGLDPNRIVLQGHSAGAQLAAAVAAGDLPPATDPASPALADGIAAVSARPDGLLLYAGPYDLADPGEKLRTVVENLLGCAIGAPECGGPIDEATRVLVGPALPPSLVVHGSLDTDVLQQQSDRLVERLCAVGSTVQYHRPDDGHQLAELDLDVVDGFLAALHAPMAPAEPADPGFTCNG